MSHSLCCSDGVTMMSWIMPQHGVCYEYAAPCISVTWLAATIC